MLSRFRWTSIIAVALAVMSTAVLSMDIHEGLHEEMHFGWQMGLRARQSAQNLQFFGESIGGASAPAITQSDNPDRPFFVEGDTFPDFKTAADRACDLQKNNCAEAANNGGGAHEVRDCDQQNDRCKASIPQATRTSFEDDPQPALVSSDANFDYFCDT
ncbi:hypothetical protein SODALDRAFT_334713 [Sodiomyces alkalinus F11]|uniref:Uncharacterized protein n=1 Tax=Sodiomyces alkalinus (strain CBS 110278 / VKM F-3762 / F11) TaxID=1314773 RepID=A0A3N2PSV8_SODAK|nr:hypothetical protein SODALDRAFT_334713 [Sodiomyces alkalinus F11]ROT37602.1 hypothetical protein SODALDRAFT_334713 [Sodiomyces alkalinus F11]